MSDMEPWRMDFVAAIVRKDPELMRVAVNKGLPINEYVAGFENEFMPLHKAIDGATATAVVAVLIEAGANVNAESRSRLSSATPVGIAARRGNLPLVQQLIAAGADVNHSGKSDVTPLSWATFEKTPSYEAVMRELLAAGAKPNYRALVGAARSGSPAMIEMLVNAGADVNEVSRAGTALILAVHSNRADTTEALLRLGADPGLRLPSDHRYYPGLTAQDVAKKL